MLLVVVLLLSVGLLYYILTRQLQLEITYQNHNLHSHEITVACNCLGGFFRWSKHLQLPLIDVLAPDIKNNFANNYGQKKKEKGASGRSLLFRFWRNTEGRRYFLSHINLQKIDLQLDLGCNDAAFTACLTGLAYALQGSLAAYLCQNCQSNHCQLVNNVVPDFYAQKLELSYRCIFAVRAVHIIIVAYKLRQLKG